MVTAQVVAVEFGIPRSTLYRMVQDGRLPAENVTRPWHKREQYRFKMSEVRKALGPKPPAPPSA